MDKKMMIGTIVIGGTIAVAAGAAIVKKIRNKKGTGVSTVLEEDIQVVTEGKEV